MVSALGASDDRAHPSAGRDTVPQAVPRRLILKCSLSPGDIVVMTAAVRDLQRAYPGRFLVDVRTTGPEIWENNPHLTPLRGDDPDVRRIDMHYPLIHHSNQRPYHFIHSYVKYLEEQLGLAIPLTEFKGDVHISDAEKGWISRVEETGFRGHFWIVIAGGKYDFTAKWWDPARAQAVVDHFRGRILFVQCGEVDHWHPRLHGVLDLVGQTDLRQFIRLMYHADGVLCPVTFAMHLAAAVETRPGMPLNRPCVVVAGGREPSHWEAYTHHQYIGTNGALLCCDAGGCWRSRCQPVGDGDEKDLSLCLDPVQISPDLRIARCMNIITEADVIRRIEMYYEGGSLRYNDEGAEDVIRHLLRGAPDGRSPENPPNRAVVSNFT
jgi:ADP-heptose:LPS heptosyltransferase